MKKIINIVCVFLALYSNAQTLDLNDMIKIVKMNEDESDT